MFTISKSIEFHFITTNNVNFLMAYIYNIICDFLRFRDNRKLIIT